MFAKRPVSSMAIHDWEPPRLGSNPTSSGTIVLTDARRASARNTSEDGSAHASSPGFSGAALDSAEVRLGRSSRLGSACTGTGASTDFAACCHPRFPPFSHEQRRRVGVVGGVHRRARPCVVGRRITVECDHSSSRAAAKTSWPTGYKNKPRLDGVTPRAPGMPKEHEVRLLHSSRHPASAPPHPDRRSLGPRPRRLSQSYPPPPHPASLAGLQRMCACPRRYCHAQSTTTFEGFNV